jgi:hypothetical protein
MEASQLIGSLALTLAGVLTGWLLQMLSSEWRERREVRRSASTAAATCLGRLKKMQIARDHSRDQVFADERAFLGSDADRFLQAVSRRQAINRGEISIFERMGALLVGVPTEDEIDDYITALIEDLQGIIVYGA